MNKFNCTLLSWEEITKLAGKVAHEIKQSDFHPDVIIGISRGGLVPSRLLCDFLHVKSCFSLKVDHWGITATKDNSAKLTHPLNKDLSGLNVLLVDDITDSGQSIELAREHLIELNPKSLKTATLYNLAGSKMKPDYFGEEREWSWLIFPWNYLEDMVNIVNQLLKDGKSEINQVRSELQENYNVQVNNEEIEKVFAHIDYLNNL